MLGGKESTIKDWFGKSFCGESARTGIDLWHACILRIKSFDTLSAGSQATSRKIQRDTVDVSMHPCSCQTQLNF